MAINTRFQYKAYNTKGTLEDKLISGDSAAAVHRDLTRRGYRVVSLRPARGGMRWLYRELPTFFGVSTADLVLFSRQLATFLKVGVPITDAIRHRSSTGVKYSRMSLMTEPFSTCWRPSC